MPPLCKWESSDRLHHLTKALKLGLEFRSPDSDNLKKARRDKDIKKQVNKTKLIFFFFLRDAPKVYEGSQARGQMGL